MPEYKPNQTATNLPIVVTKFDEESATEFVEELKLRNQPGDEEPIVITIDSYGGQIYALLSMVDAIAEVKKPVITHCLGKAMSCGAVLLSVGNIRYASPTSTVMIHEASSFAWGNVNDVKVSSQESERLNTLLLGILATRCKTKGGVAAFKKIFSNEKRDIFLTAAEAKKLGIIDHIGSPRVTAKTGWEIK